MNKGHQIIKVLTENGEEQIKFVEKVTTWIKLNPVLFGLSVVTVCLAAGFVYLSKRKQDKSKSRRKK